MPPLKILIASLFVRSFQTNFPHLWTQILSQFQAEIIITLVANLKSSWINLIPKKAPARFCRAKNFGHERDKMVQNFEKNNCLSCYIKLCILLPNIIKGLNKICLDFVHFAWTKVNEMKTRLHLCPKSPLLNHSVHI